MIVYSTNILFLPCLLLMWAIDMYLLLAALRWLLVMLNPNPITQSFQRLVDPLPRKIEQWLTARYGTVRGWVPWLIVIGGLFMLRHLLVLAMFT